MSGIKSARQANLLRALATDILDQFTCNCNDEQSPKACECGGDGADGTDGCWACQAYTALHGHGTPPNASPMSYPLLICSVCARYVRAATRTPVGVSRSWPRRHMHSTLTGIWCTGWQIPGRKAPKGAR